MRPQPPQPAGPDTPEDDFVAHVAAINRPLPAWLAGVAAIPVAVAAWLWVAGVHDARIAGALALTSALSFVAGWVCVRQSRAGIRAGRRGLRIGDAFVPRTEIEQALVLPRAGLRPRVWIRRRGIALPLQIELANEDAAQRLLRALGLDAGRAAVAFPVPSRILGNSGLLFGLILTALAALVLAFPLAHVFGPHSVGVLFPAVWLALFLVVLVPRKLIVGADGVLFTSFGSKRFIPYREIESVDTYETVTASSGGKFAGSTNQAIVVGRFGVAIELESETLEIPLGRGNTERASMAVERIREAMQAGGGLREDLAAVLLRPASLDVREWVAHLRSLAMGAASPFRGTPVTDRRLWDIVEDPGALPEARAAAAVALGGGLDEGGRTRLRVVAEATVSPGLRVVLGGVAEACESEELAVALDEVCSRSRQG